MEVALQTSGKQETGIHYFRTSVPNLVEENFGGIQVNEENLEGFEVNDDLSLAQFLQEQEILRSLPRNGQNDDEAIARAWQELDYQFSCTSLNETSGAGTESSSSSSRGNSARNATTAGSSSSSNRGNPARNTTTPVLPSLDETGGTESRGLSDENISNFPVSKYKPAREVCVICHAAYEEGDTLMTLPCMHKYHEVCIVPWLNQKRSCPLCREVFGP